MRLKKAELRNFNSGNYTATVRLASSYKVYLEDISVARNLPSAEMVTGRKVAVLFLMSIILGKRWWWLSILEAKIRPARY